MKILTNTQSMQIGGMSQSISSFLEFLEKKNQQNIDLVGIDIIRKYIPGENFLSQCYRNGQLTIITQEVPCRRIKDVLPTVSSLEDTKNMPHMLK